MSVIIIGEADGSAIKPASQQAAALAAQLGDSVGLVFGSNSAASQLAAPRVVSASALESYDVLQFAAVAAQVVRRAERRSRPAPRRHRTGWRRRGIY